MPRFVSDQPRLSFHKNDIVPSRYQTSRLEDTRVFIVTDNSTVSSENIAVVRPVRRATS